MTRAAKTADLQLRLIYSIIVAGKSARFAAAAIERLGLSRSHDSFQAVRLWIARGRLLETLRKARTGNYCKITNALIQFVRTPIDLRTCTPAQLEEIHGIGPKTSRFFILWTRPGARYAALDVHVLRWMRARGYNAPETTPSGAKYRELEMAFLAEADKRGVTPRELDAQIWRDGSSGGKKVKP